MLQGGLPIAEDSATKEEDDRKEMERTTTTKELQWKKGGNHRTRSERPSTSTLWDLEKGGSPGLSELHLSKCIQR